MQMNISYCLIEKSDEPFLWEMLYQALYVPEGEPPFPREILQQPEIKIYVEKWGTDSDQGVIALNDNSPVGAVWVRKIKAYGFVAEDIPELTIAVLPEFRGRGIGSNLMKQLFSFISSEAVSLSVTAENPAMKLYQRLGFEIVTVEGNSVTMKKRVG
jgi:ribosomal protein S18 acetylase RimI-like enzyme